MQIFSEIDQIFTFSKMVHNNDINGGHENFFIHFIGYHMENTTYKN